MYCAARACSLVGGWAVTPVAASGELQCLEQADAASPWYSCALMLKGRGKLLLWLSVKLHCWEMPGISRPPPGPGRLSELPDGAPASCSSWSRLMCAEQHGIGSRKLYFHAMVQGKDASLPSVQ